MHIILGGTSGLGLEMAKQPTETCDRVLVLGKTYDLQKHGEGFPLDVYYSDQVESASARIEQILTAMILINLCGRLDMAGAAILKISRAFAVWRKLIFRARCRWSNGLGVRCQRRIASLY